MKKILATFLILFTLPRTYAQPARFSIGTHYTGIGVYSKNFTNVFSGAFNQAALAQIKTAAAGVYGERRFMLKELSSYTGVIALPSSLGGFGIAANYFGGKDFNTSQIGLGYGRSLSEKIDIGVQFNYNMIRLSGYGSSSVINFEAGAIFHLTDKLHAGLHLYNPTGGKFGKEKTEKIASVYTMGLGYEASDKFYISAEVNKEEDQPVNIIAGMQYILADQFFARAGVATASGNYFFGLGVKWKTCRLDAVTNWHAQLGFTPGIMLLFNFHAPKELPVN